MRVLIAEADPVLLLVLKTAVEQLGHECAIAEDGLNAWEIVQATPLDVIIADSMMPGMDGLELCRRVRAAGPPFVYFIFLTSLGEERQTRTGIEAGADDYLLKPLNHHQLQLRVLVAERITALHAELACKTRELDLMNEQVAEQGRTDALTKSGNRWLRRHGDLELLAARA